jgi:glucose/arabinose dehydrogenase
VRRLLSAGDMPPASPEQSARKFPDPVAMPEGAAPLVPEGFRAHLVASGLENPRALRVAPNGDLFVANSKAGEVLALRLAPDGSVTAREVFADGLNRPYGIAFHPPGPDPEWVYVANSNGVVRFKYDEGAMVANGAPEDVIRGIPGSGHWTRDIAFSEDGKRLYLSVGSASNVALGKDDAPSGEGGLEDWKRSQPLGAPWGGEEGRAQVRSFTPEGQDGKTFATGLRNCAGLAMRPRTDELWCVVNERDGLGDNTPFEYATEVKEGGFYGWPWFYIGGHEDPRLAGARPDLKDEVTVPDVLMQAHSAPLGIAFYDKDAFPEDYRGAAFVTMHGSWNRSEPTGYKVVRLIFENGKPTGAYEDFMTGFVTGNNRVWGRPVGVAVAKDGALLVSEDGNGTIWRVTYEGRAQ